MRKPKEQRFETIAQLAAAITPENHQRMIRDVAVWMQSIAAAKITMPHAHCEAMIIVDDGKHEVTEMRVQFKRP